MAVLLMQLPVIVSSRVDLFLSIYWSIIVQDRQMPDARSKTTEWIPILGCDTSHTMSDVDTRHVAPGSSLESAIRSLSDWQRRHLPGIESPPGKAVLAHLIETWGRQTSFTDLRNSTGFRETSIRQALKQFVVLGLVEIEKDRFSGRQRGIAATPKLKECLEEYAALIARVIALHGSR